MKLGRPGPEIKTVKNETHVGNIIDTLDKDGSNEDIFLEDEDENTTEDLFDHFSSRKFI